VVLRGDVAVAFAARVGEPEAIDRRLGALRVLQIVGPVAVRANSGPFPFLPSLAVHRREIVGKADGQPDEIVGDDRVFAVTRPAHRRDVARIRSRQCVRGGEHVVALVAVSACRGRDVPTQAAKTVDASPVDLLDVLVTRSAPPVELLCLLLVLVRAMAGKAAHLSRCEKVLVHRSRELLLLLRRRLSQVTFDCPEDLNVPLVAGTFGVAGRVASQLNPLGDVGHLLPFDIGLEFRVTNIHV